MSSKKKVMTPADFDKAYEQNDVQLRGVLWFVGGLSVLIVMVSVLMWVFLSQLEDYRRATKAPANPMALSEKERLPDGPRLQSAPGFGVEGPNGHVNLELTQPAAEYLELKKQWDALEKNGEKDPKTGAVIMLPIEEAKRRLLAEGLKARSDDAAKGLYDDSRRFYSESGAGRMETEIRR
ncbi:MAG: hypothetical protein UZ17_ACD001002035 [Acidobacteria bacterium OLB17]|nr:MAG: hypothetical protein UZ17_ACD001002035 [Acidobacteria bacterium OLB17]MCZ2389934.1 hypothetical protein [Acidobacteriota bacterium]